MSILDRFRALFASPKPPPPIGSVRLEQAIKESRASRAALHEVMDRPVPTPPTRNAFANSLAARRPEVE